MSMESIRETVRTFVLDNFLPGEDPRNLTDETELKESGILDSLSTLKLVTFLEERFGVEFEANDLEAGNLSSLANIERLVESKRVARP
jgi:acyl carrier protein